MPTEIALIGAAALLLLLALGVLVMRHYSQAMVATVAPKNPCGFMPPS
jgi:hypothetical protein